MICYYEKYFRFLASRPKHRRRNFPFVIHHYPSRSRPKKSKKRDKRSGKNEYRKHNLSRKNDKLRSTIKLVFGNILSDQRPMASSVRHLSGARSGINVLRVCHFYGVRISFILINHYVISDALREKSLRKHDLLPHTRWIWSCFV